MATMRAASSPGTSAPAAGNGRERSRFIVASAKFTPMEKAAQKVIVQKVGMARLTANSGTVPVSLMSVATMK